MIYLMCGIAGMGKSFFVQQHKKDGDLVISRDKIRFSFLQPGEWYFAHERLVEKVFYYTISQAYKYNNVYIDATHLTKKSRKKTLKYCSGDVTCIYFKPDLEKAISQNDLRNGLAYLDKEVIVNQAEKFEAPTLDEGFVNIIEV